MVIWLITTYCLRRPIDHVLKFNVEEMFDFLFFKLSPLTLLSRRPYSKIS